jgi:hypothetical protein
VSILFCAQAEVPDGKKFVGVMLMVSSIFSLKDVLEPQQESFRVQSIHHLTPSFVNKTGWGCMEPLLEGAQKDIHEY